MKGRCLVILLGLCIETGSVPAADRVLLECENFDDIGGWVAPWKAAARRADFKFSSTASRL